MSFFLALVASAVLTPFARWGGLALGVVDRPGGDLKIHRSPISLLGGLAVVVSTLGTLWVTGLDLPLAAAGAVAVALAAGLADDVRPLPAWVRASLLAVSGALLAVGDLRLAPFGALGAVGVILLTMACANAVNIMDGQDGLAGGLAALAAAGLAAISATAGDPAGATVGAALAGALGGFLLWNRPPARIFLGNGGAYTVGVILAMLAARVSGSGWAGALAAGACLGVFALELILTVARRIRSSRPLAAGDRLHSYDVLAGRLTRGTVTLLFWALGAAAAGLAFVLSQVPVALAAPTVGVLTLAGLACGAWLPRLLRRAAPV